MLYTKVPFSLRHTKESTFLYSSKGIFLVDSSEMIGLLDTINNVEFIDMESINNSWQGNELQSVSIESVISYLTEEVQVLVALQPEFKRQYPCFISRGTIPKNVLLTLFQEEDIIGYHDFKAANESENKTLFIVDMIESADTAEIENFMNIVDSNKIVIFLFMVGDHFVISHAYTKKFMSPCILCLYDYIMDRVFSDKTHKISSLASVIDYINENFQISAPRALTDDLDYFYLLREIKQYLLTLTGSGRSALTGEDVSHTKIINIHTLEKSELVVPFSVRCNCANHYHANRGYQNA